MTKHTYSQDGKKFPEIIKNQGSGKQELEELREDMGKGKQNHHINEDCSGGSTKEDIFDKKKKNVNTLRDT